MGSLRFRGPAFALLGIAAAFSAGEVKSAEPASVCPRVGIVVVELQPSSSTRAITYQGRTIQVHREWLTQAADIADIRLKEWYGDAELQIRFVPEVARKLEAATTDRSGLRLAFLFNDSPLVNIVWEGRYGMPEAGIQIHAMKAIDEARRMMEELKNCTAGSVRDESRR